MFSDPWGLSPDTIKVRLNHLIFGQYHTSIYVAPDDGSPAYSLGAGPESYASALAGRATNLVSDRNRPGDLGPQAAEIVVDPGPQGEAAALRRLRQAEAVYSDKLPYCKLPSNSNNCYNSNSHTSGALNYAGIKAPDDLGHSAPGWDKPVPAGYFAPK